MKQMVKCISLFLCSLLLSLHCQAQNCDGYFPLKEGLLFEMEGYDASGKKTSRTVHQIKSISQTGSQKKAVVHVEMYDKKDKQIESKDIEAICDGDRVLLDMKMFLPQSSLEAFKNMETSLEGDNMSYPSKFTIGETLPDATTKVTAIDKNSGNTVVTMTAYIKNRKVEAKESITTPAGTFTTYKITYDLEVENSIMGIKMPAATVKAVEFISPGDGLVRSESYNEKGKMMGYQILTKLTK